MPVIVPPSIVTIPQGHRVAAHYQYDGNELTQVNVMGSTLSALPFLLDLNSLQVPANLKPIKAIQFSMVVNLMAALTLPQSGALYIVVDSLQVFSFDVSQSPTNIYSYTATIPVQAASRSNFNFVLNLATYSFGNTLADLYVNCFDFDVRPFTAMSSSTNVTTTTTVPNPLPVDVVNTSMNVFVNNPVALPVPVNQVP